MLENNLMLTFYGLKNISDLKNPTDICCCLLIFLNQSKISQISQYTLFIVQYAHRCQVKQGDFCYKYAADQSKRYLALLANIHKAGGWGCPWLAEMMNIQTNHSQEIYFYWKFCWNCVILAMITNIPQSTGQLSFAEIMNIGTTQVSKAEMMDSFPPSQWQIFIWENSFSIGEYLGKKEEDISFLSQPKLGSNFMTLLTSLIKQ